MNGLQPSAPDTAASRWFELLARAASGAVLGVAAIAALIAGGIFFWAIVAAVAVAALREWHRLINNGLLARETFVTALTMLGVIWAAQRQDIGLALIAIGAGAGAAALLAAARRLPVLWPIPWHAFGAVYVGLPVLALVVLRDGPRGVAIVGGLFVAIWTADTAALFFGRLIGGPKLAPVLSPNKTWAGFLGGTIAAGAAEACYVAILGGSVGNGLTLGIVLAVAGHCGDLFESWVKRQFHAKNTGHLIPGHGGMLDRIDSILFAAPVYALLIYVIGLNPLLGGGS